MEDGSSATAPSHASVAPECVICGTALAGPFGALFRLVGIRRSARNPNLCNRRNTHVEEGRVIELTVLVADLSGFTAMTRQVGPERTHEVVDAFLKSATYALVRHGAFIDKYVGDAVIRRRRIRRGSSGSGSARRSAASALVRRCSRSSGRRARPWHSWGRWRWCSVSSARSRR